MPDFTVGAPLAREMYRLNSGTTVDGVLTVDPVVLSYLLQATGPVSLPTGDTLTAENAVPLLLNEVYFRYEKPADQDAFFAGAAGAVFQALADGQGSASALVTAIDARHGATYPNDFSTATPGTFCDAMVTMNRGSAVPTSAGTVMPRG